MSPIHRTSKRVIAQAAAALLLLMFAASASAVHNCTVGVGNLNFGTFSGTQITSSATMTITCTLIGGGADKVNFTASLSTGAGSYVQRVLTHIGSPPDTLFYNLYLNNVPAILNTNVWGDGSGGTVTASGQILVNPGSPTQSATFTIAAAMAAVAVLPTPGPFQDSITATVTYN